MRYRPSVRVKYNIKNDEGFLVEKREKFPTMKDAMVFIRQLDKTRLIGKPIVEEK